jgi:hypothetical protein
MTCTNKIIIVQTNYLARRKKILKDIYHHFWPAVTIFKKGNLIKFKTVRVQLIIIKMDNLFQLTFFYNISLKGYVFLNRSDIEIHV